PQSVQQWESKTEPKKSRLVALASALDVDVNWLLFGNTRAKDLDQVPPENEWSNIAPWDSKTPLDNDEVEVPFLKDIELACGNGRCISVDH
ncbi:phage repressor protein, partial [Xenorhabdus bovienii]|nr:phage repressor protein [Xenorhabdus bovienii]